LPQMSELAAIVSFRVRDWGPLVAVIPGIFGMVYAFLADFFPPGGGETPMTQDHAEKLGIKAIPRNRIIIFTLSLFLTLSAVWKMFNP
jgi:hypothetical protein